MTDSKYLVFTFHSSKDQYLLTGTCFKPQFQEIEKKQGSLPHNSSQKAPIVIIASATGVPQTFYYSFAQFLATHGCCVYTFDYRGVGLSKPPSGLKGLQAKIVPEWMQDVMGLVEYIHSLYKDSTSKMFRKTITSSYSSSLFATDCCPPIVLIGHSVGGHLGPLIPGITRLFLIGCGTAYIHQNSNLTWYQKYAFSRMSPLLTYGFRYYPSHWLGLGEPIPSGVGLQWTYWSRSRQYHMQHPFIQSKYSQCTTPMLSILFGEDTLCSLENAMDFLSFLPQSTRAFYYLPQLKLGHINFFRSTTSHLHWKASLDFILYGRYIFGNENSVPLLKVEQGVGGFQWAEKAFEQVVLKINQAKL